MAGRSVACFPKAPPFNDGPSAFVVVTAESRHRPGVFGSRTSTHSPSRRQRESLLLWSPWGPRLNTTLHYMSYWDYTTLWAQELSSFVLCSILVAPSALHPYRHDWLAELSSDRRFDPVVANTPLSPYTFRSLRWLNLMGVTSDRVGCPSIPVIKQRAIRNSQTKPVCTSCLIYMPLHRAKFIILIIGISPRDDVRSHHYLYYRTFSFS